MKQEEMNDISTILIEAADERSAVMDQVSKQTKPVIIVLPEQADQIFRQPGDFFELKRLKRERGLSITLVISGHERIRNMARRQGFQVYTSAETCARAMARRDRLYTMRGISLSGTTSLVDQTRFIARGDESDDDSPPWSYDVRMQQAASTADPSNAGTQFIASATHQENSDEDTPWSYDVHMQQAASTAATPKTTRMQTRELSSDDVPWSYDVQMNQATSMAKTPAEEHPQRSAWMLAEEELWNQHHSTPTQHDQHIPPSYMVGAPLAGALPGDALNSAALPGNTHGLNPATQNAQIHPGAHNQPEFLNSGSLGETPIPPSFTETLENLVALSGEKLGAPRTPAGHPQGMPLPYTPNVYNSGSLASGTRVRPTRLTQLPDEIPTQPGNTHPYMASLAGTLPVGTPNVRYVPDTEPLYPLLETRPLTDDEHPDSRIALMLTALLILGILGGVCCGYILTLMHVNLTVLNSTISSL